MHAQLTFPDMPPKPKAELSQWFTDPALARRIVRWSDPSPVDRVLEPSAGSGSFVKPLLKAGAHVTAIEVDPDWVRELRKLKGRLKVEQADFAAWKPAGRFSLSVMNPPYENQQDERHVAEVCKVADRVVGLVRAVFMHGVERRRLIWSRYRLTRLVHFSARPHFSGAGSPRHDFTLFEIDTTRKPGGKVSVEWW